MLTRSWPRAHSVPVQLPPLHPSSYHTATATTKNVAPNAPNPNSAEAPFTVGPFAALLVPPLVPPPASPEPEDPTKGPLAVAEALEDVLLEVVDVDMVVEDGRGMLVFSPPVSCAYWAGEVRLGKNELMGRVGGTWTMQIVAKRTPRARGRESILVGLEVWFWWGRYWLV